MRSGAAALLARLFYYLKKVRERSRFVHICSTALLWPRDLGAPVRC